MNAKGRKSTSETGKGSSETIQNGRKFAKNLWRSTPGVKFVVGRTVRPQLRSQKSQWVKIKTKKMHSHFLASNARVTCPKRKLTVVGWNESFLTLSELLFCVRDATASAAAVGLMLGSKYFAPSVPLSHLQIRTRSVRTAPPTPCVRGARGGAKMPPRGTQRLSACVLSLVHISPLFAVPLHLLFAFTWCVFAFTQQLRRLLLNY